MKKLLRHLTRVGFLSAFISVPAVQAVEVDWLVLYDDYSANYFNGDVQTAMQGWVSQMNSTYRGSGVDIQLRLVGTRRYNAPGASMSDVLPHIRTNATTNRMRDEAGADFVSQLHRRGSCGIGYVSVSRDWAWNVTGPRCGYLTAIHELGHNMGLNHSRRQGNTSGRRYRYGLGYGVDNTFASVMAYTSAFNARRVNRFSNPEINCNGVRCGVPIGQSNEAFAARAIHNVRNEIANFKPTRGGGGGGGGGGTVVPPNGYRLLQVQSSGQCLNVAGNSTANVANIIQWPCGNYDNSLFEFESQGDGYYLIRARHSGKCLDIERNSADNGGNLIQYNCGSVANRQFRLQNAGGGWFTIQARSSEKCLDIQGNSVERGANVQQWNCGNRPNRLFRFTRP